VISTEKGMSRPVGAPGHQNDDGLQDDRGLRPAKPAAGVLSVLVLVGLFVTSLFRAPEPAWTVVLIVVAVGLAAAIAIGTRNRRRRR
jgi:protein-S-isoprenylcysteine O-methyltransferase Ste14